MHCEVPRRLDLVALSLRQSCACRHEVGLRESSDCIFSVLLLLRYFSHQLSTYPRHFFTSRILCPWHLHTHNRGTTMKSPAAPSKNSTANLPMIHNDTTALREEVLPLIKPFGLPGCPPHPFTPDEVVVLAAIGLGKPTFDSRQLIHYIMHNFDQHTREAVNSFLYDQESGGFHDEGYRNVTRSFYFALPHYDMPIYNISSCLQLQVEGDGAVADYDSSVRIDGLVVDARAARIFLSRHLAPSMGNFNLLALPSELRTTIHEFALSYPCLQLTSGSARNFVVYQKELGLDAEIWDRFRSHTPRTRTLDELLAITHVSK